MRMPRVNGPSTRLKARFDIPAFARDRMQARDVERSIAIWAAPDLVSSAFATFCEVRKVGFDIRWGFLSKTTRITCMKWWRGARSAKRRCWSAGFLVGIQQSGQSLAWRDHHRMDAVVTRPIPLEPALSSLHRRMPPRMNVKREPKSAIAKDAAVLEAGLVPSRHADALRIYDIRYRGHDDAGG